MADEYELQRTWMVLLKLTQPSLGSYMKRFHFQERDIQFGLQALEFANRNFVVASVCASTLASDAL